MDTLCTYHQLPSYLDPLPGQYDKIAVAEHRVLANQAVVDIHQALLLLLLLSSWCINGCGSAARNDAVSQARLVVYYRRSSASVPTPLLSTAGAAAAVAAAVHYCKDTLFTQDLTSGCAPGDLLYTSTCSATAVSDSQ